MADTRKVSVKPKSLSEKTIRRELAMNREGALDPALAKLARSRWEWAIVLGLWTFLSIFLWGFAKVSWVPHDEGLLGQCAERVLAGEWPHRDFDDPYTGGLSLLHALAFWFLGVDLASMRIVLFVSSVATIPFIYWIARRSSSIWLASLTTLTAIVWSLPNYFAPLPSWYNLFFAIVGTCAALSFVDSRRSVWLVLAGLCGGCSILFKITGLYFVAAVGLFLVFDEQQDSRSHLGVSNPTWWKPSFYSVSIYLGLFLFGICLISLVAKRMDAMDFVVFVVPCLSLCLLVAYYEPELSEVSSWFRMRQVVPRLAWFLGGVAGPVVLFLIPYVWMSCIGFLYEGVFVVPQLRIDHAGYALPNLETIWTSLAVVCLFLIPMPPNSWFRSKWAFVGGLCIGAIIACLGRIPFVYNVFWCSVRPLVPASIVATCLGGFQSRSSTWASERSRRSMFLLMAVAATGNLIQFPYASGTYFCYCAPFIVLMLTAVLASRKTLNQPLLLCTLISYLLFGVFWLNPGYVRTLGDHYFHVDSWYTLDEERGNIVVPAIEAKLYQEVIQAIQSHSEIGDAIYATADCPEIYYLANRRNPTRTFYDVFDRDFHRSDASRTQRILDTLDQNKVPVVVLHHEGDFSGPIAPELMAAIESRYQHVGHFWLYPELTTTMSPYFSVYWK